jgi:SAM-dependent methyltransferase
MKLMRSGSSTNVVLPDLVPPNPGLVPLNLVPPNFDHLARPYRWMERFTFGPLLQQARTHFLPRLAGCTTALVLGDGDGRFTAELLRRYPQIQVHAVDGSAAMLRSLEDRCRAYAGRVKTELADLRLWHPNAEIRYDLVVTHFFLDCLSTGEIGSLARRLAPVMTLDALWLVSDFAIPHSRFGRMLAAPLVGGLYLAFRILTGLEAGKLPDHAAALDSASWALDTNATRLRGLLISQLWRKRENCRIEAGSSTGASLGESCSSNSGESFGADRPLREQ